VHSLPGGGGPRHRKSSSLFLAHNLRFPDVNVLNKKSNIVKDVSVM
jgi:hypothetical protein